MSSPPKSREPAEATAAQFCTTHWSVVVRAGQPESTESRQALEELCRNYWQPLYACVRRLGHDPHTAKDLTQEFFAQFLEKGNFSRADPERGRFRTFLLTSLKHFLTTEWRRGQAEKRGGQCAFISLDDDTAEDRYKLEPATDLTPEKLFERRWAVTVLERALARLREDFAGGEKERQFAALTPFLSGEAADGDCDRAAAGLEMTPNAFRVAAHRMRGRYRECIRAEVAQTVATGADLEEEMKCLFAALSE